MHQGSNLNYFEKENSKFTYGILLLSCTNFIF